jgi:hydroxypyruvate reductase 1
LDVFEDEPLMKPGLAECPNAIVAPHIASATVWTREGMATIAGCNVAGVLAGYPAAAGADGKGFEVEDFLKDSYGKTAATGPPEKLAPSIVNADEMGYPKAAGGGKL